MRVTISFKRTSNTYFAGAITVVPTCENDCKENIISFCFSLKLLGYCYCIDMLIYSTHNMFVRINDQQTATKNNGDDFHTLKFRGTVKQGSLLSVWIFLLLSKTLCVDSPIFFATDAALFPSWRISRSKFSLFPAIFPNCDIFYLTSAFPRLETCD